MSNPRLDSDWGGAAPKARGAAPKADFGSYRARGAAPKQSSAPKPSSAPKQSSAPKPKVPSRVEQWWSVFTPRQKTQVELEAEGMAPGASLWVRQEMQRREEKVKAERANLYNVRNSGRENPQGVAGGKETVLGVDEYNSLGGRHKAAVDFNGMLRAAYNSDDKLLGLDKDKSGHVTMSELNDDVDVRGYRAAYKRMFGVDPDANTTYSPATLGLLNSMDLRDTGGRIENFTKGRGYIDADEIGRGAADGAMQGPSLSPKWMAQQGRDDMVTKLTDGMSNLQKTLESGRVQVGATGAKVRLGGVMPDEDRDNAVQVFRQGLLREDAQNSLKMLGENPRFNPSDGLDLSSLVDPNEREQRLLMDDVARFALQSGVTAADLKDPAKLRAMQFGSGQTAGIDVDRFAEHIAEMEQGSVNKGTTLEDDIMAQLGQLGG